MKLSILAVVVFLVSSLGSVHAQDFYYDGIVQTTIFDDQETYVLEGDKYVLKEFTRAFNMKIQYYDFGEVVSTDSAANAVTEKNPKEITYQILPGNKVRYVNNEAPNFKIDAITKAQFERSLSGDLNSMKIEVQDQSKMMTKLMTAVTYGLASGFKLDLRNVQHSVNVTFSKADCLINGKNMVCRKSYKMVFDADL